MFENLVNKATQASKKSASKPKAELPRTRAFVEALVAFNHRITYAALADAAATLGEHTPTGLSAGQRGSALVKNLPVELQPHVCNSQGSYRKGTSWDCEVPGDLRNRAYVRPEAVDVFVQQFIEQTDGPAEPVTEADIEAALIEGEEIEEANQSEE